MYCYGRVVDLISEAASEEELLKRGCLAEACKVDFLRKVRGHSFLRRAGAATGTASPTPRR
jgi:hypothetical protein